MDKRERIKKYGEVFTPEWVVNDMLDMFPEDAFDPEKSFLEPCCGDGVFVLEILRRKFKRCQKRSDYTKALETVWAMDIQAWCVEKTIENVTKLCEETFEITKEERKLIKSRIIQADSLKVMGMVSWLNGVSEQGETRMFVIPTIEEIIAEAFETAMEDK